jgi:hypothetical protein
MMPEPLLSHEPDASPARPFTWFCPRCRHQEVRRTVIPYQCQRFYQGQPITVAISDLAVTKCGNCGELVLDYIADQQIDRAFGCVCKTRWRNAIYPPESRCAYVCVCKTRRRNAINPADALRPPSAK